MRPVQSIIVHHSASPASTTLEDIREWHVGGNGWREVGYHYVVESDGRVRLGRAPHEEGAHARGHNAESVGVCIVGDFTRGALLPAQRAASVSLLADLCGAYGVGADRVRGHKEVGSTSCPGLDMHAVRNDIRREINKRIARWGEYGVHTNAT